MSETPHHRLEPPDRPWVMRTYAGHSTARESNELYRRNLAKGQTGLSIAFDLPTQTGYDPDHELSKGEVGKTGVSIAHKGDMGFLLDGIPLGEMNTSMTINATAAWLLALYMTVGEENGVEHGDGRAQRVRDLLHRRGARLLQVVGADVDRIPPGDLVDRVDDHVGDQPHRGPGRERVGPA